jgi:hypothetical protein
MKKRRGWAEAEKGIRRSGKGYKYIFRVFDSCRVVGSATNRYYAIRMADTPAIPFHAKVRIRSASPTTRDIDGRLGYVAGITEYPVDDGCFGYGIFIYDLSRVYSCAEAELEPTGEIDEQAARNAEVQRQRLAAKASGELPGFLARPEGAPVYHGFVIIEESRIDGWVFGAITEYEDARVRMGGCVRHRAGWDAGGDCLGGG